VVKGIQSKDQKAIFVHCDISKVDDVQRMIQTTIDTYGNPDILVNNAALSLAPGAGDGFLAEVEERNWKRILDINVNGTFYCCKYVISKMIENGGGVIVNISSIQGVGASVLVPLHAYSTSKGAIINLTWNIAVNYGPKNIRCNAICPSHVRTPTIEPCYSSEPSVYTEILEKREQFTPMGENGLQMPEDIGNLVLFLSSDKASKISGAIIPIDGGAAASIPV